MIPHKVAMDKIPPKMPSVPKAESDDFNEMDIKDTEIKINPSFYIHLAFINSQQVLKDAVSRGEIKQGLLAQRIIIEEAEAIVRAARWLTPGYDKDIKDYAESEEIKNIQDTDIKSSKIVNKKKELIMKSVFDTIPLSGQLVLGNKNN